MATFWLDSTFFNQGRHLTLYITQAQWKDKDAPRVRLDLLNDTAENLPQGVSLLSAERSYGSPWKVTFLKSTGEIGNTGNMASGMKREITTTSGSPAPQLVIRTRRQGSG